MFESNPRIETRSNLWPMREKTSAIAIDLLLMQTARITSADQIEATLAEAIANPGANFIEMMVPSQDKIIPFVPPWIEAAKEKKLPYFY